MKIAFMGAGSTIFAKNIIGDCILTPEFGEFEVFLHDIDPQRLEDSERILKTINKTHNGKCTIRASLNRREALKDADYVVNAIQVGGLECTLTDFEVPKKYGLQQTIADSMGIGGIFRALRTIPVLQDFANDIEELCPNALFLNYSNPMSMLTGYMLKHTKVRAVGLCHSVQVVTNQLLRPIDMSEYIGKCRYEVAGINHQAWLLKITDLDGNDLYPEAKRRSKMTDKYDMKHDLVRRDLLNKFGYYLTESSEHNAEYNPWFIKKQYPEFIEKYNIPIDEYIRRCHEQIDGWVKMREDLLKDPHLNHTKTYEYGSYIIKACETDEPFKIAGNVLNKNLIPNLPYDSCVEVPCLVDRNGINPCYVGNLPEQCAAINRVSINVQNLTIMAAAERKKEYIYMAAMMDPHASAELSTDEIISMCDDLIEAHGDWMPKYN